jgi:hypothetical protein
LRGYARADPLAGVSLLVDSVLAVFFGAASGKKMTPPQETYRAAILHAFQAHLARVKAARVTRELAISKVKKLGQHEHPSRALAAYDAANEAYEKARAREGRCNRLCGV